VIKNLNKFGFFDLFHCVILKSGALKTQQIMVKLILEDLTQQNFGQSMAGLLRYFQSKMMKNPGNFCLTLVSLSWTLRACG